jgi:hypothetical protein
LVDDLPRCGFVEVDLLSGGFALLDDLLEIDGSSLGEALRSVEAGAERLSFLLSLGGELFPCRTLFGFLPGALLGGLPGAGVFLGRQSGLLCRRFGREQIRSQPLQFGPDGCRCILRRYRRLERSSDE